MSCEGLLQVSVKWTAIRGVICVLKIWLMILGTFIIPLIRLLSLSVYILDKTGTAVNKVKSLLKSWQAFAGFHAEATSSGHWGNVRLTNIIKKTYQDGTAVDLNVDKERGGVWDRCMYLPIGIIIGKSSHPNCPTKTTTRHHTPTKDLHVHSPNHIPAGVLSYPHLLPLPG